MKRMKTKDHFEMLHHVPQRDGESRFARDYRAAHHVRRVAEPTPLMRFLKDAAEVIGMAALFALIILVWAVLA